MAAKVNEESFVKEEGFVKGHDFSRAAKAPGANWALAPEESFPVHAATKAGSLANLFIDGAFPLDDRPRSTASGPQSQGTPDHVHLGVSLAPAKNGKGNPRTVLPSSDMRTTPAGAFTVLQHRRPRSVVSKESEAYHTHRRNLNASRHQQERKQRIAATASGNLNAMKVALVIAVILLVAFSVVVDYKWKQWIAARKQDRDASDRRSDRRHDRRF